MPNPSVEPNLAALVDNFVRQLVAAVDATMAQRIQSALAGAFGAAPRRGPGRPPKNSVHWAPLALSPEPKRRPKQLCPVPGCKNAAAPVFGMVCKEHRDMPKAKVRQYRDKRRKAKKASASKPALAKPAAVKKASKPSAKATQARRLQGQYLGALNGLKAADKAKVKKLAAEKGKVEAVKLADSIKKEKK